MNKRALMLTAAAAALLSGRAYATNPNPPCSTTTSTTSPQLCDIVTEATLPLLTGAANPGLTSAQQYSGLGNITIDTAGELVIGTNPPNAPALTINSGTNAAPAEVNNTTLIQYIGVNDTVGVLLEEASPNTATGYGVAENWVGEYYSASGTINLTGAGVDKTGILIAGAAYNDSSTTTTTVGTYGEAATGIYPNTALPNSSATAPAYLGVFTGATGYEPSTGTTPVAVYLASGSTLEVQGTNSYGINLVGPTYTQATSGGVELPSGGASLIGDIDVGGSILMSPTTLGSTTPSSQNIAINIAGWIQPTASASMLNPALAAIGVNCSCAMVGNLHILQGGEVSSIGQGAQGVQVLGAINGYIENEGNITTSGTTAASTALNADDPEGSFALAVANNVTGGIYNAGATANSGSTAVPTGSISMIGTSAAVEISSTLINTSEALPITIGGYTDSVGDEYSLLNRGNISASVEDANNNDTAVSMQGEGGAVVTLPFGIFNSGSISSTASTNADGATASATAISIGTYVNIGQGLPTAGSGIPTYSLGGTSYNYALVNSDETGSGKISASVSGVEGGSATGILIAAPSAGSANNSLASIYNSGTIDVTASTTTLTVSNLSAYGIRDLSGTLTNVYNTGVISVVSTILDDNFQVADAIDTQSNTTTSVTITDQATASNSATITGDIHFGTKPGTLIVNGTSPIYSASVTGNIYFNNALSGAGNDDTLTIGNFGTVSGIITEANGGSVAINVAQSGTLDLLTSLPTNLNSTVSTQVIKGTPVSVDTLIIQNGGALDISVSQGFNAAVYNGVSIIHANSASIGNPTGSIHPLSISFGGYIATPGTTPSQFVLIDSASPIVVSTTELQDLATLYNGNASTSNGVPFLFSSNICAYNTTSQTAATTCTAPAPISPTDSELVLALTPKTASQLGLTGYAAKMFTYANQALINDNTLGATMVNDITNQATAQAAYSAFAPDVSGATRATAISLTDSASNVVAARQRELRMYANQEGDTTLWGQQFGERLSQGNGNNLTGYNDSGFGFVLGMDDGDAVDGRYGGAVTFFTGGMSEKEPTQAKTSSEYYLLTGYTDWRGKGLFIDTQLTAGYGNLKGRRYLTLSDPTTGATISREADGNRPTEMLAGGVTTGGIFTAGSTVFMPQFSVDGLTMREEGYTEADGGEGFDLHVQPYYANSLRAFLGADIRQDVNFGDFYLQPELRAGYRYDFVDGAVKLKANFASVDTLNGQDFNQFSITGPDPGRGNIVLGGGIATTTGSWSIGINYDYLRAGNGPTEQTGVLTLVGRI